MYEGKPVIVIGNGGHAKVLTEILLLNKQTIIGFTTPKKEINPYHLPYLGDDNCIFNYASSEVLLVNGLGSTENTNLRKQLYNQFSSVGYTFSQVIHPRAIVSSYASLGEGVQIMAGTIIQPFTKIADNTIVNTKTSIDHDCIIGSHCHIAPGSVLSGGVEIGDSTHIGTGSTIIQGIKIGEHVLVGASSLVLKNVPNHTTVYGIPAKEVKE